MQNANQMTRVMVGSLYDKTKAAFEITDFHVFGDTFSIGSFLVSWSPSFPIPFVFFLSLSLLFTLGTEDWKMSPKPKTLE